MTIKNLMSTQAIPERIYALCKLVKKKSISRDTLRDMLEPSSLNSNRDLFQRCFQLAESAELIKSYEDRIVCNIDYQHLASIVNFRRLMADKVFSDTNNIFVQFTSWYIKEGDKVFEHSKKPEELAKSLPEDFIKIDKQAILGWRFWASFLGIGFLHDSFVIPNMVVRLEDALIFARPFKVGKAYSFGEFISWAENACPECRLEQQVVPLAMSSALRILHNQTKIRLQYVPDSIGTWELYPMESHEIQKHVTDFVVKEGLYD